VCVRVCVYIYMYVYIVELFEDSAFVSAYKQIGMSYFDVV